MDKLRQLWIDGNDLSGTIPAEWASFPSLEQLYVRPGNLKLCGPLPPGITFQVGHLAGTRTHLRNRRTREQHTLLWNLVWCCLPASQPH